MKNIPSIIISLIIGSFWLAGCESEVNLVNNRTYDKIKNNNTDEADARASNEGVEDPALEEQLPEEEEEVVELPPTPEEIIKAMADAGTVKYDSAGRANNNAPINTPDNPIVALFYEGQPDKQFAVNLCVDANSANVTIHSGGGGPFGHMDVNPGAGEAGFPGECNPLVIERFPQSLEPGDAFYNHDAGNGNQQPVYFTVIRVDANGAEIDRITNVPAT